MVFAFREIVYEELNLFGDFKLSHAVTVVFREVFNKIYILFTFCFSKPKQQKIASTFWCMIAVQIGFSHLNMV